MSFRCIDVATNLGYEQNDHCELFSLIPTLSLNIAGAHESGNDDEKR